MNREITIPQEWSDVSLGEFIELSKLDISNFTDPVDYYFKILEVFGNDLNDIKEYISIGDISTIITDMTFLKEPPQHLDIRSLIIDEVEYLLTPNMNNITVGEYISIETLIEQQKVTTIGAIPIILSVILRPKGEKFNADLIGTRMKLFKEKLNIEQVIKMGVFFSTGVTL